MKDDLTNEFAKKLNPAVYLSPALRGREAGAEQSKRESRERERRKGWRREQGTERRRKEWDDGVCMCMSERVRT